MTEIDQALHTQVKATGGAWKTLTVRRRATGITQRLAQTREDRAVSQFYGDRVTRRSMVPLMHHIDEGLAVLATSDAKDAAMRAFCLHPLLQDDAGLVAAYARLTELTDSVQVIALAMEYRRVANNCSHRRAIRTVDDLELSPLREVNQNAKQPEVM